MTLSSEKLDELPLAYYCEHGNGSIEVVLWKDAADRYAALGYVVTPLIAEVKAARAVEPDHWAVWSKSGSHIGLWKDRETAERVASEYTNAGAFVKPLFSSPPTPTEPGEVVPVAWQNVRDEIVTRILDLTVVGKVLSDMTDVEGDIFCDELRSIVTGAIASPPATLGVKPLEWHDRQAASPAGTYRVQRLMEQWEPLRDGHYMLPRRHGVVKAFATEDEAKAAAQADYEQRILSALNSISPPYKGETWLPIDTAPKDGSWVDLWAGDRRIPDVRWEDSHDPDESGFTYGWVGPTGHYVLGEDEEATHWMIVERPTLSRSADT